MKFDPHKIGLYEVRFNPCEMRFNPHRMHPSYIIQLTWVKSPFCTVSRSHGLNSIFYYLLQNFRQKLALNHVASCSSIVHQIFTETVDTLLLFTLWLFLVSYKLNRKYIF